MENFIGRQAQHPSIQGSADATSQAIVMDTATASSETTRAAASLASSLPREVFLQGLKLVTVNRPETGPSILQAFKNGIAADHGLAKLYQALEGGDLRKLPTAEELMTDLNTFCRSDSNTDKALVQDTLNALTDHVFKLLLQPAGPAALAIRAGELCQVLLYTFVEISERPGNSLEKLALEQVTPLLNFFNELARPIGPCAHLEPTRIFLTAKHAELQAIADILANGVSATWDLGVLWNNREVVKAVFQVDGDSLAFVNEEFKNDYEMVMIAVQENGFALEYASEALRNNPEIVMAAVRQNGYGLEHASEELRNDPDIVLIAVQRDGGALEFAGADLQNDPRIVMAAIGEDPTAFVFAGQELRNNWRDVQNLQF